MKLDGKVNIFAEKNEIAKIYYVAYDGLYYVDMRNNTDWFYSFNDEKN